MRMFLCGWVGTCMQEWQASYGKHSVMRTIRNSRKGTLTLFSTPFASLLSALHDVLSNLRPSEPNTFSNRFLLALAHFWLIWPICAPSSGFVQARPRSI